MNQDFFNVLKKRGAHLIFRSPHPNAPIDPKLLRVGDIIQYDYQTNSSVDHGRIVTRVRSGGVPDISQHSDWYSNTPYIDSWKRALLDGHQVTEYVWRP